MTSIRIQQFFIYKAVFTKIAPITLVLEELLTAKQQAKGLIFDNFSCIATSVSKSNYILLSAADGW